MGGSIIRQWDPSLPPCNSANGCRSVPGSFIGSLRKQRGICLPGGNQYALFLWQESKMLADYAWYSANSDQNYTPVATRQPNPGDSMICTEMSRRDPGSVSGDAYHFLPIRLPIRGISPKRYIPDRCRAVPYQDDAATWRSSNRIESDLQWKNRIPRSLKSLVEYFRIIIDRTNPARLNKKAFWEMVLGG